MPKSKTSRKGPKFWAVRRGRIPGVYDSWAEAEAQVKQYPGAIHKSFPSRNEAEAFAGRIIAPTSLGLPPKSQGPTLRDLFNTPSASHHAPSSTLHSQLDSATRLTQSTQSNSTVPKEPSLSPEQTSILNHILQGENYFFTGSAGTGKSVLLRAIISAFKAREIQGVRDGEQRQLEEMQEYLRTGKEPSLRDKVQRWKLGVTASTGMAAVNIGGCTLHSWAGVGLGKDPVDKLYHMILRNKLTTARWRETGALIIDEVSMIDGNLFDKLEQLARRLRQDPRPFGGLQIILSGDFYQLPPVSNSRDITDPNNPGGLFAFEAESWNSVVGGDRIHALRKVFRQKEDTFVSILERMRKGVVQEEDVKLLKGCERSVVYDDGIEPVGLYASKVEVNHINSTRLQALTTPLQEYTAHDIPGLNSKGYAITPQEAKESLNRNTLWPENLQIKVGAMVMLITNMQDGTLVNGSTGVVVDFSTISENRLKGGYCPDRALMGNPDHNQTWPVIEFIPPNRASHSRNLKRVVIPSMSVDVNNALGEPEATRFQVPLILAYALTIHKAQGQSIERLKVDLGKVFEKGQTYVALSRATSLETLEIRNFRPHRVMAHEKVIAWAKPIEDEQADDEEWDNLLSDNLVDI